MHGSTPYYAYWPAPGGTAGEVNGDNSTVFFMHKDWLGSSRLFLDHHQPAVNATFFLSGAGTILAGGAAIAGGCLEPTPAEPLTCAAGILGGCAYDGRRRLSASAGG
jgi:hypothetical protein